MFMIFLVFFYAVISCKQHTRLNKLGDTAKSHGSIHRDTLFHMTLSLSKEISQANKAVCKPFFRSNDLQTIGLGPFLINLKILMKTSSVAFVILVVIKVSFQCVVLSTVDERLGFYQKSNH